METLTTKLSDFLELPMEIQGAVYLIIFIIFFLGFWLAFRRKSLHTKANQIIESQRKATIAEINTIIDELNSGYYKLTEEDNRIIKMLRIMRDKTE